MSRVTAALGLASAFLAVTAARAAGPHASEQAAASAGLLAVESYERGSQIVTMRPDGTRVRVLVRNAREPAWSPDGRWLAYTHSPVRSGFPSIMRVRAKGRGARTVSRFMASSPPNPYASFPSWSPDGRRIVFNTQYDFVDAKGRTPISDEGESLTERGVFVASANGSGHGGSGRRPVSPGPRGLPTAGRSPS